MSDEENQQSALAFAAFIDAISTRSGRKSFVDDPEGVAPKLGAAAARRCSAS